MENNQINILETEIKSYVEAFDQYPNDQEVQRWKDIFIYTTSKTINALNSNISWKAKNKSLVEVLYFFAPRMGSFREYCHVKLFEKASRLTSAILDCQRHCWKMAGHETHSIPKDKLFSVGQKVNLVKGELMQLGFGGHKEIADFEENHTYEIIDITQNDISNMPTYNIKFGSTIRNARHNSIVKTST